mmetsp:Transcript_3648/g.9196  ORF Transcript_3648/g.9196 Transcript_3648/m.9196 type:complete len:88 (+) Transcript_3648:451-714(+)
MMLILRERNLVPPPGVVFCAPGFPAKSGAVARPPTPSRASVVSDTDLRRVKSIDPVGWPKPPCVLPPMAGDARSDMRRERKRDPVEV